MHLGPYLRGAPPPRPNPAPAAAPPWLWHLTPRPDFAIDPTFRPRWAYGTAPAYGVPALFLTDAPRYWRPYLPPGPVWAARVAPSAAARDLSRRTTHPEWVDEDPGGARLLELLPLGDAIARDPEAFGRAADWLLAEAEVWDDRAQRARPRRSIRPGVAPAPGTRLWELLAAWGVGPDDDPAGLLASPADADALAPLLPGEDRAAVDDLLPHPFDPAEAGVLGADGAEALTRVLGPTGRHGTDRARLAGIAAGGLGVHPADAEEHELGALYVALPLEGARAVRRAAAGGADAGGAVRDALRRYLPGHRLAWLARTREAAGHWGDAVVEVDLGALGDWIEAEGREAFLYPDLAFGWGLLMDGPVPARFLRLPGAKRVRR